MKSALEKLKKEICQLSEPNLLSAAEWAKVAANCQVALMSGGESSRFQEVPGAQGANKNSLRLPNGDTMIEMTIRMYRDAGIRDFVALVYHRGETIEELLGDGSSLGVKISYSYDPEKPVGKGGAVRHALDQNLIDKEKFLIVHNPDDVILKSQEIFPQKILSGHWAGQKLGRIATVVVVEELPYAYTGMKIVNNCVTQIEMYPQVPLPTHIGVTIFSPAAYGYFQDYFDLQKKSDFEQVLFPVFSQENKLQAVGLPSDHWLAVNNLKAYQQLLRHLGVK